MNALYELQNWFCAQCNGDWEHGCGVDIQTLDNPGWSLSIDLTDTDLAQRPFTVINRIEPDVNWIVCRIEGSKFEARGGPRMLDEMIRVFLAGAHQQE